MRHGADRRRAPKTALPLEKLWETRFDGPRQAGYNRSPTLHSPLVAFAKPTVSEVNLTSEMSRVPPHNLEAEQAVLGALLIDKDAMTRIADVVTPDDFYKETHRMIMEAMMELYERREPIDVLSLTNRLDERGQLDTIGGRSYVMTVANAVPTASNILSYATIVQRKATLRRLLASASSMIETVYKEDEDIDIILDQAEQSLFKVTQKYLKQNFIPISTALTEAFERIDEIHKEGGKLRGLPTGFADLDRRLGGLQKSDLIILAARPSIGKTSLALDIVRNVAVRSKVPVGVFSLEMSKDQLVDRLISAEAKVDMWKMRTGELSDAGPHNDFERIGHALGILSEAPIYIDDSGSSNVMEIRTKARRLQAEHGLGLIVIDYLQLMEGRQRTDNRVQEVSEISRSLKALARELNVPVLALSQLSRAVEMSSPPIPKLSHLRDSGCLTGDTIITRADTGERLHMKDLAARKKQTPIPVFSIDDQFRIRYALMTKVFPSGTKQVFSLRTRSGRTIRASANHPFRTVLGWKRLDEITLDEAIALPRQVQTAEPKDTKKNEVRGRDSYQVHIQGKENGLRFLECVGSYGERGMMIPELTTALQNITSNTNVDVVPKDIWRSIVNDAKESRGYSWRDVQSKMGTSYCGSTLFKTGIGRGRMQTLANVLENPILTALATSDVFWDEVVEIHPSGIEKVYDATVAGLHNFLANDIFVHNSIEQDSDVVLFIYREGYYKKDSMRPNEADIIISKHRNGPTGEISLIFQNEYVSFANMARESAVGEPPPPMPARAIIEG